MVYQNRLVCVILDTGVLQELILRLPSMVATQEQEDTVSQGMNVQAIPHIQFLVKKEHIHLTKEPQAVSYVQPVVCFFIVYFVLRPPFEIHVIKTLDYVLK